MSESILIICVVMGPAGAQYTVEQLESRKKSIWREIHALVPATRFLVHSEFREKFFTENDQMMMGFELVDPAQLALNLCKGKSARTPIIVKMLQEADALRKSAEFTQLRIGEIANLLASATNSSDTAQTLLNMSVDEKELLDIAYATSGKSLRLRFPNDELLYQFPDLPIHYSEPETRNIVARVVSVTESYAELSSTEELEDIYPKPDRATLPKRIRIYKTRSSAESGNWRLLYAALDSRARIEAKVRVALKTFDSTPAHLELIQIINSDGLKLILRTWST